MPFLNRVRRTIGARWYALMPTDKLLKLVADQGHSAKADILIEALKERRAHQDGSLDHLDWSSARLSGALLSSCRLKHARFSGAQLRGAYFGYSDACSADFSGSDLREANLREARLTDAIFDGANLRDANLARAILRGSSFVAADLTKANLWGADLRGANLTKASLADSKIFNVMIDASTILPDGRHCADAIRWSRFIGAERSGEH